MSIRHHPRRKRNDGCGYAGGLLPTGVSGGGCVDKGMLSLWGVYCVMTVDEWGGIFVV